MKKIVGNKDIRREMLACAVDVSETDEPDYIVLGYKVNSSSLEYNVTEESGRDVNGRRYSSVDDMEISQTFEPHRVTGAGRLGELSAKLVEMSRAQDFAAFSQFKCVLIYGFLENDVNKDGKPLYSADEYDACTIIPQSLGGEAWLDFPIQIKFGGNVNKGYSDGLIDDIKFYKEGEVQGGDIIG